MTRSLDVFRLHMPTLMWTRVETSLPKAPLLYAVPQHPLTVTAALHNPRCGVSRGVQTSSGAATPQVDPWDDRWACGAKPGRLGVTHRGQEQRQQINSEEPPQEPYERELLKLNALTAEWSKTVTNLDANDAKSFIDAANVTRSEDVLLFGASQDE
ncbi:hypothetical protein DQ04_13681020 [Trypanosoma grayi]|uniref:hypothetical protein n=1 Tax=Trypanosoma grayi TaxID=71804 RepID=UPI0004F47BD7|nr:hypothetical protein DQ04_13681020 [Trypanosoma grayi]KEG06490.1 hypothetical protein DQ04_13681020 [Trypanosoma grayi]